VIFSSGIIVGAAGTTIIMWLLYILDTQLALAAEREEGR
jgi:hypothetical protein